MKNLIAEELFSMTEAETYGNHYGEKAQHNERAERIRREQNRKISYMDWKPIQNVEIALYLSKAFNWKSPGHD